MTRQRTGGQVLVAQLERHGVDRAFCVPGESYLEVLDALHDSALHLVVCRQEGGAGYMADAYARATGQCGVCLVTRGPGAANAFVSLHTAWQDRTPLLLLVGLVSRYERDREAFQEFDLRGWFGTTAKLVTTVDDANRLPEVIARAIACARSGRPGPVVVGLPEDMLRDEVDVSDFEPMPLGEGAVSTEQTEEIGSLLSAAQRPLIVLGGTGWTEPATRQLARWAERWELPVATDFRCQDLIDNESPSYVGPLGYGRDEHLADALATADAVLSVGSPLGDVTTDGWTLLPIDNPQARIVTVLPDPEAHAALHPAHLRLTATPAAFAQAIAECPAPSHRPWGRRTRDLRATFETYSTPTSTSDAVDLGQVFQELHALLPPDAIVTFGAGNHAIWAQRYLRHQTFPCQLAARNGSMGYGVPAAVAAALAHPHRTVVSVAGDGCFLMNGQEVSTAVVEGVAPVIVVMNNGMYGTIRQHQELNHPGRVSGTHTGDFDFAAYARAFGGHGEVVTQTEEFHPALERALQARVPSVIDLRANPERLTPEATITDVRTAARDNTAQPS